MECHCGAGSKNLGNKLNMAPGKQKCRHDVAVVSYE
jgi:hypothetical protein